MMTLMYIITGTHIACTLIALVALIMYWRERRQ